MDFFLAGNASLSPWVVELFSRGLSFWRGSFACGQIKDGGSGLGLHVRNYTSQRQVCDSTKSNAILNRIEQFVKAPERLIVGSCCWTWVHHFLRSDMSHDYPANSVVLARQDLTALLCPWFSILASTIQAFPEHPIHIMLHRVLVNSTWWAPWFPAPNQEYQATFEQHPPSSSTTCATISAVVPFHSYI